MQIAYNRSMPALQIRDFPEALHRLLAERAKQQRRTIAQEATVLLSEALTAEPQKERRRAVLAELGRNRRQYDFSRVAAPEDLIRADRRR